MDLALAIQDILTIPEHAPNALKEPSGAQPLINAYMSAGKTQLIMQQLDHALVMLDMGCSEVHARYALLVTLFLVDIVSLAQLTLTIIPPLKTVIV
jgi:hypothetical protein